MWCLALSAQTNTRATFDSRIVSSAMTVLSRGDGQVTIEKVPLACEWAFMPTVFRTLIHTWSKEK